MALLDLKTDLKSLKYGKDRPGGGDSGQPYQQTDINKVDTGFNRFRMTKFDDGLVRGGIIGTVNASIVDTFRIGKFLKDFPKGPLFIVKQVGLQMSNPILEHKTNFPTNRPTKGQGLFRNVGNAISNIANKILNAVGPTRIYNLGINTLAQVPVNAFGQHIVRHGFLPKRDDSNLYLSVAQYNNNAANNRLTQLTTKFGLGDFQTNPNQDRKLINTLNIINSALSSITRIQVPKISINPEQLTISRYVGGPESIYGLGSTVIQRYTFTEDASKIDPAKNRNYNKQHIPEIRIKKVWDYGVSSLSGSILASNSFNLAKGNVNDETPLFNYNVTSYNAFEEAKNNQSSSYVAASRKLRDDRLYYIEASKRSSSTLSNTSFPELTSTENERVTLDDNISTKYKGGEWSGGITASNDLGLSKISGSDISTEININQNVIPYLTPSLKKYEDLRKKVNETSTTYTNYNSSNDTSRTVVQVNVNRGASDFKYVSSSLANQFNRTNDKNVDDDTMVIRITPLDPFTGNPLKILNYLGYITTYNETYDSSWGDVKYVGRAEKFYIFNEFKRSINLAFNVPCFNPKELQTKHCEVSELASALAGKYNNNLLGGIIIKLRVGGYIIDQPGIITNLSFSPVDGSPWDIDAGFAQYLNVNFNFTVIHNYLPQYQDCGFLVDPPIPPPPAPKPAPSPAPAPAPTPQPKIKQPITVPPTDIDNTGYRFPGRAGELQGQQPPTKFGKNAFQEKLEQNYLKNTLKGG